MHALALTAILVSGGVFDAADGPAAGPCACSASSDHGRTSCGPHVDDAALGNANFHLRSATAKPRASPRCAHFRRTLYARPYDYRNLLDYPWHAPRRVPPSSYHHHHFSEPQLEQLPPALESPAMPVDPSAGILAPRHEIARGLPRSKAAPAGYYREAF